MKKNELTLSNIVASLTKVFKEVLKEALAEFKTELLAELSVDNAMPKEDVAPSNLSPVGISKPKATTKKSTSSRKYYGRRRPSSKKTTQKSDTPKVYEPITFLYISTPKNATKKVKEANGLEIRLKTWDKNHDRYVVIRDWAKELDGEVNAKRFTFKKSEVTRAFLDKVEKAYPDTQTEGVKEF